MPLSSLAAPQTSDDCVHTPPTACSRLGERGIEGRLAFAPWLETVCGADHCTLKREWQRPRW